MYGLSMNSCNTENEKKLIKSFQALQQNEYTGLPIFSYSTQNIPIHKEIPNHFKEGRIPECVNFPNLRVLEEDLEEGCHGVSGLLTQVVSNYPEAELEYMMEEVTNESFLRENPRKPSDNPYAELIPYFVDLTTSMQGWCVDNDFVSIKEFLITKTAEFKGKALSKLSEGKEKKNSNNNETQKRKIVSSSIPCGKKKKAHGTKHF